MRRRPLGTVEADGGVRAVGVPERTLTMDNRMLVQALSELSRAATDDFLADTLLTRLCDVAGTAVVLDGAGVMVTEDGINRFVHATTTSVAPLERLQELLRAGPCREALVRRQSVVIADLIDAVPRAAWPEYTSAARELGLRSVVAVPLVARGRVWGVLDLYRSTAQSWTQEELAAATVLAGIAVSYLVMAHDRDTARTAQLALAHQAMHDDLTGLANRALLYDRLEHALAASRRRNAAVAVLFIDLDRFKQVNDTFGHAGGDTVLVEVATRMGATLRGEDTLGRLAGDEFVLICENLPTGTSEVQSHVAAVTARIRRAFDAPIRLNGVDVTVSASIGVAVTTDGPTAQDLLGEADTAMYGAKQRGRGMIVVRDHTTPGALRYARQFEHDLAAALERDQLVVHFQPIVSAHPPQRVVAVEALLRWRHPDGRVLPAASFIDVAISSGLITAFGRWVITQTCAHMRAWNDLLDDGAPATAYLNLSARELADVTLPDTLTASLHRYGLQASQIGLEIVEDDLADPDTAARIAGFRRRGHPLAIDDFGTGYSSLSRLLDMPADLAKIDKSFVHGIPRDTRRTGLIDAVLAVADKLNIQVVAEGIETAEQQQHLTAAGCHLLQGYLLGHPQAAADLTATWAARADVYADDKASRRQPGDSREPTAVPGHAQRSTALTAEAS